MKPYSAQPDGSYIVKTGMMIDGDGSPHCYAPEGSGLVGLDYLANGGRPGDWWGLACDGEGNPYIQGKNTPAYDDSSKGFYVSTTSYVHRGFGQNDPHCYLNAETELYVVVPSMFRRSVRGVVLGCKCVVEYNGKEVEAVTGDIGPDFGEASIAVAHALGIPGSPKSGGVQSGVVYRFYPGIAAAGYTLEAA